MGADEALRRMQEAFRRGRWQVVAPHGEQRMRERSVSYVDVKHAVANATRIEPYSPARPRGTAGATTHWRLFGPDLDGDEVGVGLDLTRDALGDHALVVTVL